MRIRPTELGLKGLALFAGLVTAFLATSYSNLFFLMLAFCSALGVLGLCWTVTNVRGVALRLAAVPAGPAGEPRAIQLELQPGRRARFDLALTARLDDRCVELTHVPTAAGATTIAANLPDLPRGVHTCTALEIVSRYPFGLFQVTRTLSQSVEVVTWPRPTVAAGDPSRAGDGAQLASAGAASHALAGLRAFRTGDSHSEIHWKATARRGTPIVKERERERGDLIALRLDRRCDAAQLDRALSLAAEFVLQAHQHGRRAHLLSQGHDEAIGTERAHRDAALRWLAAAMPLPMDAPAVPDRLPDAIDLLRLAGAEAARA